MRHYYYKETTSGNSEVINKSLTRLDIADDEHGDIECPIKIAATSHAVRHGLRAEADVENILERLKSARFKKKKKMSRK